MNHLGCLTRHQNLWTTFLQEFWDWSWEELAQNDLASMISYVYSETNSKVFYIGHSQVKFMCLFIPNNYKTVDILSCVYPCIS